MKLFKRQKKSACLVLIFLIISLSCAGEINQEENLHRKNTGSIGFVLAEVVDWSTGLPFLNLVKQSRKWLSQKEGYEWGKGGDLEIDDYGWVKKLNKGQYADLIFITVTKDKLPFKEFRVRYEGDGLIEYHLAAKKIRKGERKNEDIIRVLDNVDGTSYGILRIKKTNPNNYIRNISIVPVKYAEIYDKGEIFNPLWIEIVKGFNTFRYMDWMRTNDSRKRIWKERPKIEDRTWATKGVPLEVMIALSNKLKINPWFNIHHTANDLYIRNFAKVVKKLLSPNLKVYTEHSNEVWNWAFPQSHYAEEKGKKLWGKDGMFMDWHGMRTAKICDIWKLDVFKDSPDRVHCTLGTQVAWKGLEYAALECPHWKSNNNKKCFEHGLDSIAITGYFSGCLHGVNGINKNSNIKTVLEWASSSETGIKKAFEQIESGKYFKCFDTLEETKKNYRYFVSLGKKYKLDVVVYEGGSHVTALGTPYEGNQELQRFLMKINHDKRMKDMYLKNLLNWKDEGGTLFMHYVDVQRSSQWGSFGAMENLLDKKSPKYQALYEFNNNVKCWWDGC